MKKSYQTRSLQALFEPTRAGALHLANRIVMAPLTRNRAGSSLEPGFFALEYYAQRASAGLIVAEATQISAQAQGCAGTPGCYTKDQVRGWKRVTEAEHAEGGTIVVQLWHTGRVSHTSFQPAGRAPVGPSAIRANTKTFVSGQGFIDVSMPRALQLAEIPGIIDDFRDACDCALEAGFDGVELHGAHGYLLDAFLRDGTNHRADAYGGSIENRTRLLLEVAEVCADAVGGDRLGSARRPDISGFQRRRFQGQQSTDAVQPRRRKPQSLGLAYLHVVEGETGGARDSIPFDYAALRDRFDGVWMVNNGYDRQMAIDAIASGRADLVSFGRGFIANPDLVGRLKSNAPLNELMGQETLYGGGAHGYTDYPTLEQSATAADSREKTPT